MSSKLKLKKHPHLIGIKTPKTLTELPEGLKELLQQQEEIAWRLGGFQIVELPDDEAINDRRLDEVRQHEIVEKGTHVYCSEEDDEPLVPTGELYLLFTPKATAFDQQMILQYHHLQLIERIDNQQLVVAVSAQSPNPIKVAESLEQSSLIAAVEADLDGLPKGYFTPPTDNLLFHQWHLENNGPPTQESHTFYAFQAGADAKIKKAWERLGNMGSEAVKMAIIDWGFDLKHPDFQSDTPYIETFNLLEGTPKIPQGKVRSTTTHVADNTHGTPCAGLALARANGKGTVGVAPHSQFMALHGTGNSWYFLNSMFSFCMDNNVDVISCSWGDTRDIFYPMNYMKARAITKAATEGRCGLGIVIVFAVGDDNLDKISYLADHPNVIAVAASTSRDEVFDYSNRGNISVCAPSGGAWPLLTPKAHWDHGHWFDKNVRKEPRAAEFDQYRHFSGSSGACPIVAGICALVLSANPHLTAAEVKEVLQLTADKIGGPNEYDADGFSPRYGYGRVNADRAVEAALHLLVTDGKIASLSDEC